MSNPTDRFDSSEEAEWDKEAFDAGAKARVLGKSIDDCPNSDKCGPFGLRSWCAGWADADITLRSEAEQMNKGGN